jgi:hypothetical protein
VYRVVTSPPIYYPFFWQIGLTAQKRSRINVVEQEKTGEFVAKKQCLCQFEIFSATFFPGKIWVFSGKNIGFCKNSVNYYMSIKQKFVGKTNMSDSQKITRTFSISRENLAWLEAQTTLNKSAFVDELITEKRQQICEAQQK